MQKTDLNLEETRQMFIYLADHMIASKDALTQADKAIGDGDHGIGMAKGFEAVRAKVAADEFACLADLFRAVGFALMTSVGGASGAIFGTLYQGGAIEMGNRTVFDAEVLARLLVHGLAAVKKRGKAKLGDKTMVDALEPAAQAAAAHRSDSLSAALAAVCQAAETGVVKTKAMVATMGRAKSLGERALGHPDPGAVSTHLILSFMADFATGNGDGAKPAETSVIPSQA